jgi:hypothetical protein
MVTVSVSEEPMVYPVPEMIVKIIVSLPSTEASSMGVMAIVALTAPLEIVFVVPIVV